MISLVVLILVFLSQSTDSIDQDDYDLISGFTEPEEIPNNIPPTDPDFIRVSGPDGYLNVTLNTNDTPSSDEEGDKVHGKPNRMEDRNLFSVKYYPKSGDLPLLNRKIFRAMRVTIMEHPYIASIRRNYSHYLTGTIITRTLVLTVAQPIKRVPIYELGVVVGENYSDRGTTIHPVLLVIMHPNYNDQNLDNDIAMLRIHPEVMYTMHVKPIFLYTSKRLLLNHTAFVTGWGRCDWNGEEMCLPRYSAYFPDERIDPMLRTVAFSIESDSVFCNSYSKLGLKLSPGMLCLGPARNQDETAPCLAVPGAPLVVGGQLMGVLSWGFGCGYHDDQPLIYTDLRKYNGWLEDIAYNLQQIPNLEYEKMYLATIGYLISQILIETRATKPENHHHEELELEPMPCDEVLALMNAKIYDIRDYVYHRHFHEDKRELYFSLRMKKILSEKPWLKTTNSFNNFILEDIDNNPNTDVSEDGSDNKSKTVSCSDNKEVNNVDVSTEDNDDDDDDGDDADDADDGDDDDGDDTSI